MARWSGTRSVLEATLGPSLGRRPEAPTVALTARVVLAMPMHRARRALRPATGAREAYPGRGGRDGAGRGRGRGRDRRACDPASSECWRRVRPIVGRHPAPGAEDRHGSASNAEVRCVDPRIDADRGDRWSPTFISCRSGHKPHICTNLIQAGPARAPSAATQREPRSRPNKHRASRLSTRSPRHAGTSPQPLAGLSTGCARIAHRHTM